MAADKSPDAFRTISEVAEDLDIPQHVLRFWETRFSQIKPLKRGGGRRYYRPDDVELLKGIRTLLYGEGYTIRGVQRILKEQGLKHVIAIGLEADGAPPVKPDPARLARFDQEDDDDRVAPPARAIPTPPATERREPTASFTPAATANAVARPPLNVPDPRRAPPPPFERAPIPAAERPVPPATVASVAPPPVVPPVERAPDPLPAGILPPNAPSREASRLETGAKTALSFIDRLTGDKRATAAPEAPAPRGAMSRDDIRKLQSTLFELLECKRMLDQARG
jgi:DNA-binding transcriptional MerR regulator